MIKKKYPIGKGHYCHSCYKRILNGERPSIIIAKSDDSKTKVDRKRKMTETGMLQSDSHLIPKNEKRVTTDTSIESPSFTPSITLHGWVLQSPSANTQRLSNSWLEFHPLIPSSRWYQVARGNLHTLDLLSPISSSHTRLESLRSELLHHTEIEFRDSAKAIGLSIDHLYLSSCRLLASKPKDGHQQPHIDYGNKKMMNKMWSVILYCVDTDSTSFNKLPLDQQRNAISTGDTSSHRRNKAASEVCQKENFISIPVDRGSIGWFNGGVIHHGVENRRDYDRIGVYGLFTLTPDPDQDMTQKYPLGADDWDPDDPTSSKKHKK